MAARRVGSCNAPLAVSRAGQGDTCASTGEHVGGFGRITFRVDVRVGGFHAGVDLDLPVRPISSPARLARSTSARTPTLSRISSAGTKIVAATGATQSNISKHLSLLAASGVITRQKGGQFVYDRMTNPLTLKLCELVHKEMLKPS